jgi:hypothetical protein
MVEYFNQVNKLLNLKSDESHDADSITITGKKPQ